MKPFRQFFSKPHQRPGEVDFPVRFDGRGCWWDDAGTIPLAAGRGFNVQVVGEAQFQSEIGASVGGRCTEGHNCEVPAELVLAGNDVDPQAIGVLVDGRPVGWLPSELSATVRPRIAAFRRHGKLVTCKAKIVGGWDRGRADRGYFGVKLSLSMPLREHPAAIRRRRAETTSNEQP